MCVLVYLYMLYRHRAHSMPPDNRESKHMHLESHLKYLICKIWSKFNFALLVTQLKIVFKCF